MIRFNKWQSWYVCDFYSFSKNNPGMKIYFSPLYLFAVRVEPTVSFYYKKVQVNKLFAK